jgi:hypothetical protein
VALDLNAVMDAIGVRLATISGLRVADYPADQANPPQAIVSLPETVEYDSVMGRGADRVIIPITVLVGKVSDRAARDALAQYVSGTGSSSVKAAVDGDLGGTAHTARVTGSRIDVVTIQAIDYLGASFDVEVYD